MVRHVRHYPYFTGLLDVPVSAVVQVDFGLPRSTADVALSGRLLRRAGPAAAGDPRFFTTNPGCTVLFHPGSTRLYGPMRKAGTISLRQRNWAISVRFQPAATAALSGLPAHRLVDRRMPCPEGPAATIREIVEAPGWTTTELLPVLADWLLHLQQHVDEEGRLVNRVCQIAETDETVQSVAGLARLSGLGIRSLGRLTERRIGLNPHWLIERRRLRLALLTIERYPYVPLASVAADSGYFDQSHFTRVFRQVLGMTPGQLQKVHRAGSEPGQW